MPKGAIVKNRIVLKITVNVINLGLCALLSVGALIVTMLEVRIKRMFVLRKKFELINFD